MKEKMEEKKQWHDEGWTKTRYMREPIWEYVENHINALCKATANQQEFLMQLDGVEYHKPAIRRQVALAIYTSIRHAFNPSDEKLIELTRSRQSHWNFMLLGKKGEHKLKISKGVLLEPRIEQPFTDYFLVKMIYRLGLHGITIDWDAIHLALELGGRWRVYAKPSDPDKQVLWHEKYGGQLHRVDYPAPWSIANEFNWEARIDEDQKVIRVPCAIQNDGVKFIDVDGSVGGVWVLEGVRKPSFFEQDHTTSRMREVVKELQDALYQSELKRMQDLQELDELRERVKELKWERSQMIDQLNRPIHFRYEPVTGKIKRID